MSSNISLPDVAALAGELILENGGETYRAEETAVYICRESGFSDPEVIAYPTGVFVSVKDEDGNSLTTLKRIQNRTLNLTAVDSINVLSRKYSKKEISLTELNESLNKIKNYRESRKSEIMYKVILWSLSSAMFAMVLEKTFGTVALFDMFCAMLCSAVSQLVITTRLFSKSLTYTSSFFGSAIIAIIALTLNRFFGIGDLTCTIVAAIAPSLPGMALTNSIRDLVMGDIVSGTSRAFETLIIAVAISSGVGVVFAAYLMMGGVL